MSLSSHIRSSSLPRNGGTTAETLIDDLLLEIISRVPARHRWRCKCVCKHWLGLARKLPQSLAGFFYNKRFVQSNLEFLNVSGTRGRPLIHPSFDFLPHPQIDILDCCNGLLLCRWYGASTPAKDGFQYVVCNPATEEWVALPDDPGHPQADDVGMVRLGFDPAAACHFHVFVLLKDDRFISGVDVYSSETGRWVHKEKGWNRDVALANPRKATVFLNSCLHFLTFICHGWDLVPCLAAVDTDGETWTNFGVPNPRDLDDGFIQQSQGRLHYASLTDQVKDDRLVIYVLEDYARKGWVLKHVAKTSDMFGSERSVNDYNIAFDWIAIHPECNVIFFTVGFDTPFMCYNMDTERTRTLRTLQDGQSPYLPYVPLYSELQSLHT